MQMLDQQVASPWRVAEQGTNLVLGIGVDLASLGVGNGATATPRMGVPFNPCSARTCFGHNCSALVCSDYSALDLRAFSRKAKSRPARKCETDVFDTDVFDKDISGAHKED